MNSFKVNWYIQLPYQVGEIVVRANDFMAAQMTVKSMMGPKAQITSCVMLPR